MADATPVDATRRGGDDLVGIFYTGGTTGRSKGVMLSHRSLIHNVLQSLPVIHMTQDDVYLHAAPMFHIADAFVMLIATTMGSTHVFVPVFEPTQVMQSIQDEKVTIALLVPTMINLLVNHPELPEYDLSSLKNFPYGGSAVPASSKQPVRPWQASSWQFWTSKVNHCPLERWAKSVSVATM